MIDYDKRLLDLADFIEKLLPEQWNYSAFLYDEPGCGTVGCAIGWAASLPFAEEEGVEIKPAVLFSQSPMWTVDGKLTLSDAYVAHRLFDVDGEEFEYLFLPGENGLSGDASSMEVAAHIRKFVEEHR